MEQSKEEDTLEQRIIGRHEAFEGAKELVQMGSL